MKGKRNNFVTKSKRTICVLLSLLSTVALGACDKGGADSSNAAENSVSVENSVQSSQSVASANSSGESGVDSSIASSVESSVDSSVADSVDSSVDSSIASSVESSVDSSIASSGESGVDSSIASSVESSVDSSVVSSVDSSVDSSVVSLVDKVTEEAFIAALSFESSSNVTVKNEFGFGDESYQATTHFDGDKIRVTENGAATTDTFIEVSAEQLYVYTYVADEQAVYTGWIKMPVNITDEGISETLELLDSIQMYAEEIGYAQFTYKDGFYTCQWTMGEGTEYATSVDFKLQFEKNVLISLRMDYEVEGMQCYELYEFSAYGTTAVALPAEYIEVSELTPTPSGEWADYFNFDNVTDTISYTRVFSSPTAISVIENSTIQLDGEKWAWTGDGHSYNSLYFDGKNMYVDGELVKNEEEVDVYNIYNHVQNIGGVEVFAAYESNFAKVAEGVYVAESLNVQGQILTNIQLIVQEGKLQSAGYTYEVFMTVGGYTEAYTAVVTHTFSNWGMTMI